MKTPITDKNSFTTDRPVSDTEYQLVEVTLADTARELERDNAALRALIQSIILTWDSEDQQERNDMSDSLFTAINLARHNLSNERITHD